METSNTQFLFDALFYLGFGETLRDPLTAQMESRLPEFELPFNTHFESVPVAVRLFFKRSADDSFYLFAKYRMTVGDRSHSFDIYKGKGITLKEGYNLLSGRAVYKRWRNKEENKSQGWLQLELDKQENGNYAVHTWTDDYGFDVAEALAQLKVTLPSSNWDMAMLIRSLERGNLQAVTIEKNFGPQRVSICANPRDKDILVLPVIETPELEHVHPSDDVGQILDKKKSKPGRLQTK